MSKISITSRPLTDGEKSFVGGDKTHSVRINMHSDIPADDGGVIQHEQRFVSDAELEVLRLMGEAFKFDSPGARQAAKAVPINPLKREMPPPRKARYTRVFKQDELVAALRQYLELGGVMVPEGKNFLWGLEMDGDPDREHLTLVIDSDADDVG